VDHLIPVGEAQKHYVPLRSKPVRLIPIALGNGDPGYLVVGTVRAKEKPWRQKFTNRAEAEKVCEDWETERLRTGATIRVRATVLS
jgi:hypothetical protein